MPTLRQTGGLSGYPNRAESPHDWIENSHASTALSYADGIAKAFQVRGERRPVVAVVGDGALTGGMCWEALNNIAAADRPVIVVINDNGRSYDPTIGGFAQHLAGLRLQPGYEKVLGTIKHRLPQVPVVGPPIYDALHGVKRGIKDLLSPQGMFEDLGLKYLGPVDGHDLPSLEHALSLAKRFDASGPSATTSWRSPQPCANRPGWARSRAGSRTGSTTSASPSSTRSHRPPASPQGDCTPSWRSTRRSSTARSTRCSWTWRCTGCP
jgi:deoxyxylulose-5-phosphate synthase